MDGMVMPMNTPTDPTSTIATVLATAAVNTISAFSSVETSASSAHAEDSDSMNMQGMASFLHFGLGDPFLISFFTPTTAASYVAICFFFAMLTVLQRILQFFITKLDRKWHMHFRHAHVEPVPKSGSWVATMDADELDQTSTTTFNARLIVKILLHVLNTVLGFLVYVAPADPDQRFGS